MSAYDEKEPKVDKFSVIESVAVKFIAGYAPHHTAATVGRGRDGSGRLSLPLDMTVTRRDRNGVTLCYKENERYAECRL